MHHEASKVPVSVDCLSVTNQSRISPVLAVVGSVTLQPVVWQK